MRNRLHSRRGGALVAALVTLLVVMLVASAIVRSATAGLALPCRHHARAVRNARTPYTAA